MNLDQIKAASPIEEIINDDEPLRGQGRWWRGIAHDSLVVDATQGTYHWNSRGEWGDVIQWVQNRNKLDFKRAVEWLCGRAGLPIPEWNREDAQAVLTARIRADTLTVAARHWVHCLRAVPAATEYATARGWSEDTIQAAGLGYVDGDVKALKGELQMHGIDLRSKTAQAILKAPKGHLVYPHVVQGRVIYLTMRLADLENKAHWNPPADLVGERRPYFNHEYAPLASTVAIVEGQADAVTLGQWRIPAVALAGTSATTELLARLGKHPTIVLGLDADEAGKANTAKIADALGPMTRIVRWPKGDANAWLQAGAGESDVKELMANAPTWVERVAITANQVEELEREAALRRAFALIARMDDFGIQMLRPRLADALDVTLRQFNALLKAAQGERETTSKGDKSLVTLEMPGGHIADHLLEMIVIPPDGDASSPRAQWDTQFACRFPDGSIQVIEYLDLDGVRFTPISAKSRMLTEGVVQFPSAIGESQSLRELAGIVRQVIHKYVDLDVFYEHIATYYVLFTWLYDSFNTVPYLRMLGDAGTGKSRFIQVVGAMCYRPTFVTGAATVSPIFRILDRYSGTLVLDEADYKSSDEAADIIKILNTGYQKIQGVVLRSGDKNEGFMPEVFRCFGPKVIATRKRFADWALESRCLTNEAGGPTTRADIPIDLPRSFWRHEAVTVRNALLRYRLENWQPEIELNYDKVESSVEPRLNQVTVALQTLIDDPDLSEDLRSFIQEYNQQLIVERGMTLAAKVLESIVGLHALMQLNGATPVLTIGQVTQGVNTLIDAENKGQASEDNEEDKKKDDKQVKPHKVGHIVRKELHLGTQRGGKEVKRAYVVMWDQERIDALCKRFGIENEWLEEIKSTLASTIKIKTHQPELPKTGQDDDDMLF